MIPAVTELLKSTEGDEKVGVQMVAKALEEPIRQIAANAGIDGSVVLEKVRTSGQNGYGFDAYKEVYCDMIANGIVDPAKVTRSAHRVSGGRQARASRTRCRSRHGRHGRHVLITRRKLERNFSPWGLCMRRPQGLFPPHGKRRLSFKGSSRPALRIIFNKILMQEWQKMWYGMYQ